MKLLPSEKKCTNTFLEVFRCLFGANKLERNTSWNLSKLKNKGSREFEKEKNWCKKWLITMNLNEKSSKISKKRKGKKKESQKQTKYKKWIKVK